LAFGGVADLGLEFDELIAEGDEFGEFLFLWRLGLVWAAGDGGPVAAQHVGIETIGLGEDAASFGIVADPGSVEDGDGDGGGVGGFAQAAFVAARGFDQQVGVRRQTGKECAQTGG